MKNKLFRWATLLLACTLLFTGCFAQRVKQASRAGTIAASSMAKAHVKNGLERFCDELALRSGGTILLTVSYSENPVEEYLAGTATFLYTNLTEAEKLDTNISFINMPFLYRNYTHFTLSAHANIVTQLLRPSLSDANSQALGFFYQGTTHLVSTIPLTSEEELLQLLAKEKEVRIYLLQDSNAGDYFDAIGMRSTKVGNTSLRYQGLERRAALLAEFTTQELFSIRWTDSKRDYTYIPSFHDTSIDTLLVRQDFYQNLSPTQVSMLQEQLAYLYPLLEDEVLFQENMILSGLRSQGVTISTFPLGFWKLIDSSTEIIRKYDDYDEIAEDIILSIQNTYKSLR